MNSGDGEQGSAGGSMLSSYNAWKASVPFVTRTVLLTVTVLGILSLIGFDFGDYLANQPAYTLYYFEVYRVVLSVFVATVLLV